MVLVVNLAALLTGQGGQEQAHYFLAAYWLHSHVHFEVFIKMYMWKAGEVSGRMRMFAALVEDLSLVPVVMPHLYFQPHTGSDALLRPQ